MALADHLEKLHHFVGVAKAGSIRGYALSHRLSQPAISKAVRILETELESALFVRSREGIALTPSGRELFEFAQRLLEEVRAMDERIGSQGKVSLKGSYTLGTYQSIAVYFLPRLVKYLGQVQRNIQLNSITSSSRELVRGLQAGSVDFIISIDPPKLRNLVHVDLFEDAYSLYGHVARDLRASDARVFTLPSAKDKKGKKVSSYLESEGLIDRMAECGDFEAAKAMAENDAGWALLPDRVANPLVKAGKIKRVTTFPRLQSIGKHQVVFSSLRHRASDHGIRWMAEQIRLMLKSDAGI